MPPITEHGKSRDSDIMIVDDNPVNLKLLEEMLQDQNYEVRSFPLGRLALAAATKHPPDLILLDITMPEMNGFEVCERLKANEQLSKIPIIFLSALSETEDKVRAFQAGASDYISKPFRLEEVHARVKTHLSIHALQEDLRLQNLHLEDAVAARTRELAMANARLTILDRSKNEFLSLISHEFRTLLNGILGVGELLLEDLSQKPENAQLQGLFGTNRRRILSILEDALLLTEIDVSQEQFKVGPISLSTTLERAANMATEFAKARSVTILLPPVNTCFVFGEGELLVKALQALLETAVKFSSPGEVVKVSEDAAANFQRILIDSSGRSVPEDALPGFFEVFTITEALTPDGDFGLGPPVACRVLSLFGASVTIANRASPGIRLTVSLIKSELDV